MEDADTALGGEEAKSNVLQSHPNVDEDGDIDVATATRVAMPGYGADPSLMRAVVERLRDMPALQYIDLSFNRMTPPVVSTAMQALGGLHVLTDVNLSGNALRRSGTWCVDERLPCAQAHAAVRIPAVSMLADVVRKSKSLAHLRLSECGLNDLTVHMLSNALVTNKTVCSLDLSKNKIGWVQGQSCCVRYA